MTPRSRSSVVSSFTIVKGAMIDETYQVFTSWDLAVSKRANLDRLRESNYIGAASEAWLRYVAKVFNRRFEPTGTDRALLVLAKAAYPIDRWQAVLLWHATREEFLLRDFLVNWLYPEWLSGTSRLSAEQRQGWTSLPEQVRRVIAAPLQTEMARLPASAPIPLLGSERDACEGRLRSAIRAAQEALEGERLASVQVNSYFAGGIESEEQMDSPLAGLREECVRLIGAGNKVVLS